MIFSTLIYLLNHHLLQLQVLHCCLLRNHLVIQVLSILFISVNRTFSLAVLLPQSIPVWNLQYAWMLIFLPKCAFFCIIMLTIGFSNNRIFKQEVVTLLTYLKPFIMYRLIQRGKVHLSIYTYV